MRSAAADTKENESSRVTLEPPPKPSLVERIKSFFAKKKELGSNPFRLDIPADSSKKATNNHDTGDKEVSKFTYRMEKITFGEMTILIGKAIGVGDAKAQNMLGLRYYFGRGIFRDYKAAIRYVSLAAEQGDVCAQFNLGAFYEEGLAVKKDLEKAVYHYTLAARQQHEDAQENLLGVVIDEIGQFNLADPELAQAKFNPWVCHKKDQWTTVSLVSPVLLNERFAKQRLGLLSARAQFNVGVCFYNGIGAAPKDFEIAVRHFRNAANYHDHAGAQNNLGFCYYMGHGVSKDRKAAIKYFKRAAAQGHKMAQSNLKFCSERPDKRMVAKPAPRRAYYWDLKPNVKKLNALYPELAAGKPTTPADTSQVTDTAEITRQKPVTSSSGSDYKEHRSPFASQTTADSHDAADRKETHRRKAKEEELTPEMLILKDEADSGDIEPQYKLGFHYYFGQGVAQSYRKAIRYWKLAANAKPGHVQAQYLLGYCYLCGQAGLRQNQKKAVRYLKLAAKQGYADAQNGLGNCYRYSMGLSRDLDKARYWYTQAIKTGSAESKSNLEELEAEHPELTAGKPTRSPSPPQTTPEIDMSSDAADRKEKKVTLRSSTSQIRANTRWDTLMRAITTGDTDAVRICLQSGKVDFTKVDENGWLVLSAAASRDNTEIVTFLLIAGADPSSIEAASMEAAHNGHLENFKNCKFLFRGNPNYANDDGWTILMSAAYGGNSKIVKLLLAAGADPTKVAKGGCTALIAAVDGGIEVVKLLLAVDTGLRSREIALARAAERDDIEIVKLFLAAGVDPYGMLALHSSFRYLDRRLGDLKRSGRSALSSAIELGHAEIVKLCLKKHKPDLFQKNCHAQTLFGLAARAGNIKVIEHLIKYHTERLKTDPIQYKHYVRKCLEAAVGFGIPGIVELLLKRYNANPNQPPRGDVKGRTLLMISASSGVRKVDIEVIRILLANNADPTQTDKNSNALFYWVNEEDRPQIRQVLCDALFEAAARGNQIIVYHLLRSAMKGAENLWIFLVNDRFKKTTDPITIATIQAAAKNTAWTPPATQIDARADILRKPVTSSSELDHKEHRSPSALRIGDSGPYRPKEGYDFVSVPKEHRDAVSSIIIKLVNQEKASVAKRGLRDRIYKTPLLMAYYQHISSLLVANYVGGNAVKSELIHHDKKNTLSCVGMALGHFPIPGLKEVGAVAGTAIQAGVRKRKNPGIKRLANLATYENIGWVTEEVAYQLTLLREGELGKKLKAGRLDRAKSAVGSLFAKDRVIKLARDQAEVDAKKIVFAVREGMHDQLKEEALAKPKAVIKLLVQAAVRDYDAIDKDIMKKTPLSTTCMPSVTAAPRLLAAPSSMKKPSTTKASGERVSKQTIEKLRARMKVLEERMLLFKGSAVTEEGDTMAQVTATRLSGARKFGHKSTEAVLHEISKNQATLFFRLESNRESIKEWEESPHYDSKSHRRAARR